jgi:hypothetical protein
MKDPLEDVESLKMSSNTDELNLCLSSAILFYQSACGEITFDASAQENGEEN